MIRPNWDSNLSYFSSFLSIDFLIIYSLLSNIPLPNIFIPKYILSLFFGQEEVDKSNSPFEVLTNFTYLKSFSPTNIILFNHCVFIIEFDIIHSFDFI